MNELRPVPGLHRRHDMFPTANAVGFRPSGLEAEPRIDRLRPSARQPTRRAGLRTPRQNQVVWSQANRGKRQTTDDDGLPH